MTEIKVVEMKFSLKTNRNFSDLKEKFDINKKHFRLSDVCKAKESLKITTLKHPSD